MQDQRADTQGIPSSEARPSEDWGQSEDGGYDGISLLDVDGLPSRFEHIDRWIGAQRVPEKDGFITTGDIVQSR